MHLKEGFQLQHGKYRIEKFISQGGFGCTYLATHVKLNKSVAIKEFFVSAFCNRDQNTSRVCVGVRTQSNLVEHLRQKFYDEAQAISSLQHPGIVNVFDVFDENDTTYYVMDFIDGHTLAEMVSEDKPMDWRRAVSYIRQAAAALDYVHSTNRLHLDLKPANIMVRKNDRVVLIDFGVSKQYNEGSSNTSTVQGLTAGYAPLEQMACDLKKFNASTDIYSLGATLYKLVTGQNPPEASTVMDDGLSFEGVNLPESLVKAITKAMMPQRAMRPQSMSEFVSLLPDEKTTLPPVPHVTEESEGTKKPEVPEEETDDNTALAGNGACTPDGNGGNGDNGGNDNNGAGGNNGNNDGGNGNDGGVIVIPSEEDDNKPKKGKHSLIIGLIVFLLLAIAGFACYYFFIRKEPAKKHKREQVDPEQNTDPIDSEESLRIEFANATQAGDINKLMDIYAEGDYYDVAYEIAHQCLIKYWDTNDESWLVSCGEWLEKSADYSSDAAVLCGIVNHDLVVNYDLYEYADYERWINVARANMGFRDEILEDHNLSGILLNNTEEYDLINLEGYLNGTGDIDVEVWPWKYFFSPIEDNSGDIEVSAAADYDSIYYEDYYDDYYVKS